MEGDYTWRPISANYTILFDHIFDNHRKRNYEYLTKIDEELKKKKYNDDIKLSYDSDSAKWSSDEKAFLDQWKIRIRDADEDIKNIIEAIKNTKPNEKIGKILARSKNIYLGKYTLNDIEYPIAIYGNGAETSIEGVLTKVQVTDDDELETKRNKLTPEELEDSPVKYIYCDETYVDYIIIGFYEENKNDPTLIMQIEKFDLSEQQFTKELWLRYLGILGEEIDWNNLDEIMANNETLTPEKIKQVREMIAAIEDEEKRGDYYLELQGKVEYKSQRDNEAPATKEDLANNSWMTKYNISTAGDIMCNLTSEAMCLEYLGIFPPCDGCSNSCNTYDQFEDYLECIRVDKDIDHRGQANSRKELAKLFNNVTYTFEDIQSYKKTEVMNILEPYLKNGCSILISSYGHIVRLQGFSENGLVVDDPYGKVVDFSKSGCSPKYKKDELDYRNGKDFSNNEGNNNIWKWKDLSSNKVKINYAEIYCNE